MRSLLASANFRQAHVLGSGNIYDVKVYEKNPLPRGVTARAPRCRLTIAWFRGSFPYFPTMQTPSHFRVLLARARAGRHELQTLLHRQREAPDVSVPSLPPAS